MNDEMKIAFYEPDKPVSGASYSLWFKLLATLVIEFAKISLAFQMKR